MCFECSKEPSHRDGSFEALSTYNICLKCSLRKEFNSMLLWERLCDIGTYCKYFEPFFFTTRLHAIYL